MVLKPTGGGGGKERGTEKRGEERKGRERDISLKMFISVSFFCLFKTLIDICLLE